MLQMCEEGLSSCAGPAAVAPAGNRGEALLSSGLDSVMLREQERGQVLSMRAVQQCSGEAVRGGLCPGSAAALAGWRAALLWHGQCSVYPQTSLQQYQNIKQELFALLLSAWKL